MSKYIIIGELIGDFKIIYIVYESNLNYTLECQSLV